MKTSMTMNGHSYIFGRSLSTGKYHVELLKIITFNMGLSSPSMRLFPEGKSSEEKMIDAIPS